MQWHMYGDDLNDNRMMDMQDAALANLLEKDYFDGSSLVLPSEYTLFELAIRWATQQCVKENLDHVDGSILRKKLNSRLYLIRFAAMTTEDFHKCISVGGTTFFSDEEISATFLRIARGPGYIDTPIPKHLNGKGRVFRLEVNRRTAKNPMDYQGCENWYSRNKTHNWYIVGFETDAIVNSISNNLFFRSDFGFSQTGNRVVFTIPFLVETLRVSVSDKEKYVGKVVSSRNHPNLYLRNINKLSIMSACYFCKDYL